MPTDSTDRIAQLHREIAALEAGLASVAGIAGAEESLRAQIAQRRAELAALTGGAPPATTQIGGVNMGPGASVNTQGDIVGGNKGTYHGPVVQGNVTTGRDFNLAGGDQTITNYEHGGEPPAPPATPVALSNSPLRLALADAGGAPIDAPLAGEEAQLRLEFVDTPQALPALRCQAVAEGVDWLSGTQLEVRPRAGQPLRLPRWPFVAAEPGPLTLQVLLFAGGNLLQVLSLETEVPAPGTLSNAGAAGPRSHSSAAVVYAFAQAPAAVAGDDTLTLVFRRSSEMLGLLLLDSHGQSWEVALPLSDNDLHVLLRQVHSELRDIVLRSPNRAFLNAVAVDQAVADATLRRLAETGARFWSGLFNPPGASETLHSLRNYLAERSRRGPLRITIAGHRMALPWALLYDGDPGQAVRSDGFWGLRHQLAVQPIHGGRRASAGNTLATSADGLPALLAFNQDIERQVRAPVITEQRTALAELGLASQELAGEAELLEVLSGGSDAALIYLYCHAHNPLHSAGGLSVDLDEIAIELTSRANALRLGELRRRAPAGPTPRLRNSPLVIVNACSSAESSPLSFGGLAPYLLDLGASAVVGTAVETPIRFGAAFGPALLEAVLRQGLSIGAALRETRLRFLHEQNNPLGLLYGLYGNGEALR